MVGNGSEGPIKRPMSPSQRQDRARAARGAPGGASRHRPSARGGGRARRLPGGRRGPRPAARPRPSRPRPRRRGRRERAGRRLGGEVRTHERFATATVRMDDLEVDLATTRSRVLSRPRALSPRSGRRRSPQDLARRDFTLNAMACRSAGDPELIDPHGGLDDLGGAAAGPARRLLRRRPDPRPAGRSLRGALRLRAGARYRAAAAARPTSRRCRATASRPSSASSPASPRRAAASSCSTSGALLALDPALRS